MFYFLCELLNLFLVSFRFLVFDISRFLYVSNTYFSEDVRSTKVIFPYQAVLSVWQLHFRLKSVLDGLLIPLFLFAFHSKFRKDE